MEQRKDKTMSICNNCGKTTYLTHWHSCEMKPKKKWQGLTDDELLSACKDCDHGFNISGFQQGALWADKVLKEKNNG